MEKLDKLKTLSKAVDFVKKTVIFCLVFVSIYVIVAITFQAATGTELSPTLTEKVITFYGTELCLTCLLKGSETVINFLMKRKKEEGEEAEDLPTIDEITNEDEGLGTGQMETCEQPDFIIIEDPECSENTSTYCTVNIDDIN